MRGAGAGPAQAGRFDAVVVGGGVNGMVAAALLADAGWSVAIVERGERLGGFVAEGRPLAPGYVHDRFASWHPLFVASPAYAALGARLRARGLEYVNATDAATASVSTRGVMVGYRDVERTAAQFAHTADGSAYRALLREHDEDAAAVLGVLGSERGPVALARAGGALLMRHGIAGAIHRARRFVQSGRAYVDERFVGWEADQLWVPWLLHAGLAPDDATGGLILPMFATSVHRDGLPIVRGGAGRFVEAFTDLLEEGGVTLLTGTVAERILVSDGTAIGVLAGGRPLFARRAVLASVTPAALYGRLLPPHVTSAVVREQARAYRAGRGAAQIHLALDRPVRWRDPRLDGTALVHVSEGAGAIAIACAEAAAGRLPAEPTIVVGQQYVIDPTRVPPGGGALWLQLQEAPLHPVADGAGELRAEGRWTPGLADGYLTRVLHRIERFAPGVESSVVAAEILTPADLRTANLNAIGGDPYSGALQLDQSLLWRPLPQTRGHRTPVRRLWHIGAATHPGPGLGAGSGWLVARGLLRR